MTFRRGGGGSVTKSTDRNVRAPLHVKSIDPGRMRDREEIGVTRDA